MNVEDQLRAALHGTADLIGHVTPPREHRAAGMHERRRRLVRQRTGLLAGGLVLAVAVTVVPLTACWERVEGSSVPAVPATSADIIVLPTRGNRCRPRIRPRAPGASCSPRSPGRPLGAGRAGQRRAERVHAPNCRPISGS